ncbi:hypothetical protein HYT55_02905 [Candidatus Woesearchaeota archaeon]|nr:hypothetical protein [Candidatus Woesearchaeota archaeon]
MRPENIFFIIFIATILVVRIGLYVGGLFADDPDRMGLSIKGMRIHHWTYGALMVPVGIFLGNIPLLAVGSGLFIDELTYLMMGGETHADNYSFISLIGTVFFVGVVFLLRKQIVFWK